MNESGLSCSPRSLALFTRQLPTLVDSGVPLLKALESLGEHQPDEGLEEALHQVLVKIESGHRYSQALSHYPGVFPEAYVAMVAAGEQSGKLVAVLDSLADWMERDQEIRRRVTRAVSYPLVTLGLSFVLLVLLFWTIVPGLLETVSGLGGELPWPTLVVARISQCLQQPLFWILAIGSVLPMVSYARTAVGREEMFVWFRQLPLLGHLLTTSCASRYAFTLSLMLDSGMHLVKACQLAGVASGSPILAADAARVVGGLRDGVPLSQIWRERPEDYPPALVFLMMAGEESARMNTALNRAAAILEREANFRIDHMTAVLEPLMLAWVAVAVGFTVVSLMLPITNLLSVL